MVHPSFAEEVANWIDTEAYAKDIVDRFTGYVNADPKLKAHRDYIEQHAYGFGERAFHHLWKLLVEYTNKRMRMLEIGVYKGQVLSLVRMLSSRSSIFGVTRLDNFSGPTGKFPTFPRENYKQHIEDLHNHFGLRQPTLIIGDSTDEAVKSTVDVYGPYDIVYVDGCHEYDYVCKDLMYYPKLVKPGGLLVVDDSACNFKQPWGFFQGIDDVCRAVTTVVDTDPQWEHLLVVMHNRVWRRI